MKEQPDPFVATMCLEETGLHTDTVIVLAGALWSDPLIWVAVIESQLKCGVSLASL